MAKRDSTEDYNGSKAREITVVCIESILENQRKINPYKDYKSFLYSSGITEIFLTQVTPQPLPLR